MYICLFELIWPAPFLPIKARLCAKSPPSGLIKPGHLPTAPVSHYAFYPYSLHVLQLYIARFEGTMAAGKGHDGAEQSLILPDNDLIPVAFERRPAIWNAVFSMLPTNGGGLCALQS